MGTAPISRELFQGTALPVTGTTFDEQMAQYEKDIASGALDPTGGTTDYTPTIVYLYVLFLFLWTTFFIQDFCFTSLSGKRVKQVVE